MAMMQPAAAALDGGDPRASFSGQGIAEYSRAALKASHDPSVTIEEYMHYAKITRAEQASLTSGPAPVKRLLGFGKSGQAVDDHGRKLSVNMPSTEPNLNEKNMTGTENEMSQTMSPGPLAVTDEEWLHASRAARVATWGAIFYLITTDVLGPYSVPWAMAQMGYGPGITLYTVFGALAGYTGWQIWSMFLALDSHQYPMKTYGDIAFRIYGRFARHGLNFLQSVQLVFNVGVIIIGNGQGLYQVNERVCFIAYCIIWTVIGMVLGQIRTLQKFGWIANAAIWINILIMIMTMVVVTHTVPNYDAAFNQNGIDIGPPPPPVHTTGGAPADVEFTGQVVGLMQAVYSYGGAMLYCEFMSEMKKPMDFWKALLLADSFIYIVYLFFGIYVYSFQGQYTVNPANQGMSPHAILSAGNIISFIATIIAAALYGNIGIKVIYQNVLKEFFGAPDLTTKKGKLLWMMIVPIYWGVAFVLAGAIPQFSALSGLVAAVCILQFTYTFPPILMLGLNIQRDAVRPEQGEGFNPETGITVRHDKGIKRWVRGFFAGRWYINTFNLIMFFGALCTAGLGAYSSIEGIIAAFAAGRASSFSCKGPI